MASTLQAPGAMETYRSPGATDALDALLEAVRDAVATRTPLSVRGGGTKAWYGQRTEGAALDVRLHAGVIDYEPSELVMVARAGTPLAEVEALLARHRQMLAFEPPHFAPAAASAAASALPFDDDAISRARSPRPASATTSTTDSATPGATLGGCIAAGLSGPRRMAAGAVRDFVLGARVIDGRGQHLAFGGKVMKNVAGYDVSRVLVGSLGTLGVLTEVSFKVLPQPSQSVTLAYTMDEQPALDRLNQWAGQAIAITASAWTAQPSNGAAFSSRGGRLLVRLEGSEAAVQAAIRRIGGLDVDPREAAGLWRDLREQTAGFFAERPADATLWRLALPSTAPPLDATTLDFADQLIEWGGAQRWIATRADPQTVRAAAAALGGHATAWRASAETKATHGVFAPLSAPLFAIHRRLKDEFDPHRLFNRGRMYADL